MRSPGARADLCLLVILALGLGLRIWLVWAWRPAFLGYPDSVGYLEAAELSARGLLFVNQFRPAGYPMFLVVAHAVTTSLTWVIVVQHLFGLACAALLYLTVRRAVTRRWTALLPAIVVAFSGTELFLEHSELSESLYTLLVVIALFCAGRSLHALARWAELGWLAVAGVAVGASAPVRSVGIVLVPVFVGWALATRPGAARRVLAGVTVLVCAAATLGVYLVDQHSETGTWGLTRTTGDTLYARTAVFADCRDFTPPAGTAKLCPPPGAPRQGPTEYMLAPGTPAVDLYGLAPGGTPGHWSWAPDAKLQAFAIDAIEHQPWAYVSSTLQGLVKYVDPSLGEPQMLEWRSSTLIDNLVGIQPAIDPELAAYYPGEHVVTHDVTPLADYARFARVEGPVTAVLLALLLCSFVLGGRRRRASAGLFGWVTVAMLLAPVVLLFYGARYATPAYGPLAAGAAIGLDALLARVAGRRGQTSSEPGRG